MDNEVVVLKVEKYDKDEIKSSLPDELFSLIRKGDTVVLKPNWVLPFHSVNNIEWEQVITHPQIITAVIEKTIEHLGGEGRILIIDGPELNADFKIILSHYPFEEWKKLTRENGILFGIIDLRDELYVQDGNVTISKIRLEGDPAGKVTVNLRDNASEFYLHKKSHKGYYGAGPDIAEANNAHNGSDNIYSVSMSAINADVFINLPKLKTHKKAGITASLKNLVGINTYRNFLPHYSIGTIKEGGDQFPGEEINSRIESSVGPFIKQHILTSPFFARLISPFVSAGKKVFGDNTKTIRSGSWYGNDTLWRTILDLNKILLYSDNKGIMKSGYAANAKKYITIVDAIIAGEGDGPKNPDPKKMFRMFCGTSAVAVDAVCAKFMGFDPMKVPSIANSFLVKEFKLAGFSYDEISVLYDGKIFSVNTITGDMVTVFKPHRGWNNLVEN